MYYLSFWVMFFSISVSGQFFRSPYNNVSNSIKRKSCEWPLPPNSSNHSSLEKLRRIQQPLHSEIPQQPPGSVCLNPVPVPFEHHPAEPLLPQQRPINQPVIQWSTCSFQPCPNFFPPSSTRSLSTRSAPFTRRVEAIAPLFD